MAFWLYKSEPFKWSWEMQKAKGDVGEEWTGVRNYLARNNMRAMKIGDKGFFYHSNEGLEIVGITEVCALSHPDSTAEGDARRDDEQRDGDSRREHGTAGAQGDERGERVVIPAVCVHKVHAVAMSLDHAIDDVIPQVGDSRDRNHGGHAGRTVLPQAGDEEQAAGRLRDQGRRRRQGN